MKTIGKKGAVELSVSTIVIIVLAMTMLILGLVLVKTIFSGAQYNVEQMNDKVKDEINKLFVEDQRALLYLPSNNIAEIKQGSQYGLAFSIQNTLKSQTFSWKVELNDNKVQTKCGVDANAANGWITTGGEGNAAIDTGQKYPDVVRFNIPSGVVSDVSTCILRYKMTILKQDNSSYQTIGFDIQVK